MRADAKAEQQRDNRAALRKEISVVGDVQRLTHLLLGRPRLFRRPPIGHALCLDAILTQQGVLPAHDGTRAVPSSRAPPTAIGNRSRPSPRSKRKAWHWEVTFLDNHAILSMMALMGAFPCPALGSVRYVLNGLPCCCCPCGNRRCMELADPTLRAPGSNAIYLVPRRSPDFTGPA